MKVEEQTESFSRLDNIVMEATGQKFKALVQRIGFSQSQLAAYLDRDIKTISNYYCRKSLPDKMDLLFLSRLLGKTYEDLLVFQGDVEGYQRVIQTILEADEGESMDDVIKRLRRESKLLVLLEVLEKG